MAQPGPRGPQDHVTAELLGISRELVHDLLRTGQLGSVKAGRRRLIAKHHLEAFLAGEP
jgi:excisionase family DNA binding protein